MHLSQRMMLSLFCGVTAVSMAFAAFQVQAEMHALSDEIQRQAIVLGESQRGYVEQILQTGSSRALQALVDEYRNRGHLAGMAIYDDAGNTLAITSDLVSDVGAVPTAVVAAVQTGRGRGDYFRARGKRMHVFALPLSRDGHTTGAIAIFHDVAFIEAPVWRHAFTGVAETLLIVSVLAANVRFGLALFRV